MAEKKVQADVASLSFEQALEELESLSQKMGQGNLSLEDAVVVYERGVRLSQHCQKLLDKANKKIRELDKELMAVNPSSTDEEYDPYSGAENGFDDYGTNKAGRARNGGFNDDNIPF